jgi:predicted nucleotide-binding protein
MKYHLSVDVGEHKWGHESPEEFFSDYRHGGREAVFQHQSLGGDWTFRIQLVDGDISVVEVECPNRAEIERVYEVFEANLESSRILLPIPKPKPVTIFIGHGGSPVWRDLKDHLHDQHSYEVIAYEIGARAGHAIRDILEDMLSKSSFALLVLTGEDESPDGKLRARQNVVHELGLFQGRLGFSRAIVLLENGTEEFSNIFGMQQLRFSRSNIKEVFGDVLATLRREFALAG